MDKKSEPEFDSIEFEKKLLGLKDTQDSIQAMSAWCLQNKMFHKKIVTSWLGILKQGEVKSIIGYCYCTANCSNVICFPFDFIRSQSGATVDTFLPGQRCDSV